MIKKITFYLVLTLLIFSTKLQTTPSTQTNNKAYASQNNHKTTSTSLYPQRIYKPRPATAKLEFSPEQLEKFAQHKLAVKQIIFDKLIEQNVEIETAEREAKKYGDKIYQHERYKARYAPKKTTATRQFNDKIREHNTEAIDVIVRKIVATQAQNYDDQLDNIIPNEMLSEQNNVQSLASLYQQAKKPYRVRPTQSKLGFTPEQLKNFTEQRSAIREIISAQLTEQNIDVATAKKEAKKYADRCYQHLRYTRNREKNNHSSSIY